MVHDLGTTVSGVQSAIALEALVSAAFILIGSKVGDLIGRKRAYVLGLLGYAVGALAMTMAQGLTAIIVFWAVIGGLGASMLLPAMQSLIHGNFTGDHQKRVYALVGAAAAIAAAVGPLLGGVITTLLSWRVAFLLEAVIIAIVLIGACRTRWRWLWLLHPLATLFVVVSTDNHYWLDGLAGSVLVLGALWLTRPRA